MKLYDIWGIPWETGQRDAAKTTVQISIDGQVSEVTLPSFLGCKEDEGGRENCTFSYLQILSMKLHTKVELV